MLMPETATGDVMTDVRGRQIGRIGSVHQDASSAFDEFEQVSPFFRICPCMGHGLPKLGTAFHSRSDKSKTLNLKPRPFRFATAGHRMPRLLRRKGHLCLGFQFFWV